MTAEPSPVSGLIKLHVQYPDQDDEAENQHRIGRYPCELEELGQFDRVVLYLKIAVFE